MEYYRSLSMEYLKVNTIYPAYMGECNKYGIGVPCTFIRLNGCNLRCYLKKKGTTCDTPEALDCADGKRMEVSAIIKSVRNIGNKVICLTGGEPLLQDCTKLLTELVNDGFNPGLPFVMLSGSLSSVMSRRSVIDGCEV